MTTMTITPVPAGEPNRNWHIGAHDALTEATTTPLHILQSRARVIAQHAGDSSDAFAYALGYNGTLSAALAQEEARAAGDAVLARYQLDDQLHAAVYRELQQYQAAQRKGDR